MSETRYVPSLHRRWFVAGVLAFWAIVLTAVFSWSLYRGRVASTPTAGQSPRWKANYAELDGQRYPYAGTDSFVWDKDAYVRPRDSYVFEGINGPIGGPSTTFHVRHVEHGIVRPEPVGSEPGRPVVLWVGDSHMYGTFDTERNATVVLEQALRREPDLSTATVVNASCPFYNPYQYFLRVRSVWDQLRPKVVVVVIFTGNDLHELEDVARVHLDDAMQPQAPCRPAKEESEEFLELYRKSAPPMFDPLFWQGIGQAMYFHRHPARYAVAFRKAIHSVELVVDHCADQARVLVVLLPAYDDFLGGRLPFDPSPELREVLDDRINQRFRMDLREALAARQLPFVDATEIFDGRLAQEMYLGDFHISPAAHALLAEALVLRVRDLHRRLEK